MKPVHGVYAIYNRATLADDALAPTRAVLEAGASWLQYRDKRAGAPDANLAARLLEIARDAGAGFVVNDDWRLALRIGADGVHLGADDAHIRTARAALGPNAVIGASCSGSLTRARAAAAASADYLSFGRFFDSQTKPDAPPAEPEILTQARILDRPVVAIGGIDATNAGRLVAAGADAVAVSGAIFHARSPAAQAQSLASWFDAHNKH